MRNLLLGVAVATLILASSAAIADPPAQLDFGVYHDSDAPSLDAVGIYFFGGRNYCWYDAGWQGPGYYWCGYAWRGGYGWGGAFGWNGWRGGHPGGYSWGGGHFGYRGRSSFSHGSFGSRSSAGHFSAHSSGGSHGPHH
ncbi:MAG: hypothetical protein ABSC92_03480 [Rhizomicrobium sp.]|jgi:hypothetical protein